MMVNFNDLSELIYSSKNQKKKPALFFDRDGVLIKECNYISSAADVSLEECAKDLVRFGHKQGWIIIIVSNQSGISRELLSWKDYIEITEKMISLFGKPNPFSAVYANSQGPQSNYKNWRKPSPNMLLRASEKMNIDLGNSILIGDRKSDLLAGLNSGIKTLIHLNTGHGKSERKKILNLQKESKYIKDFEFININNLCEFPTRYLYKII